MQKCVFPRKKKHSVVCSLSVPEKWWLSGQEGCAEDSGAQPQTEVKWCIMNDLDMSYQQYPAAPEFHKNVR